jgi:hypothetical protein
MLLQTTILLLAQVARLKVVAVVGVDRVVVNAEGGLDRVDNTARRLVLVARDGVTGLLLR